jgi:hypothetical protein
LWNLSCCSQFRPIFGFYPYLKFYNSNLCKMNFVGNLTSLAITSMKRWISNFIIFMPKSSLKIKGQSCHMFRPWIFIINKIFYMFLSYMTIFFYIYTTISLIQFFKTLHAHLHFIRVSKVNLHNIHVNKIFDYATTF